MQMKYVLNKTKLFSLGTVKNVGKMCKPKPSSEVELPR